MKKRKFIPPKPLIVVHHPAGVKVQIPLKDLTEFTKSMCHLYRFHWKAKKTADALERVNRLSMEAMVEWTNEPNNNRSPTRRETAHRSGIPTGVSHADGKTSVFKHRDESKHTVLP